MCKGAVRIDRVGHVPRAHVSHGPGLGRHGSSSAEGNKYRATRPLPTPLTPFRRSEVAQWLENAGLGTRMPSLTPLCLPTVCPYPFSIPPAVATPPAGIDCLWPTGCWLAMTGGLGVVSGQRGSISIFPIDALLRRSRERGRNTFWIFLMPARMCPNEGGGLSGPLGVQLPAVHPDIFFA